MRSSGLREARRVTSRQGPTTSNIKQSRRRQPKLANHQKSFTLLPNSAHTHQQARYYTTRAAQQGSTKHLLDKKHPPAISASKERPHRQAHHHVIGSPSYPIPATAKTTHPASLAKAPNAPKERPQSPVKARTQCRTILRANLIKLARLTKAYILAYQRRQRTIRSGCRAPGAGIIKYHLVQD